MMSTFRRLAPTVVALMIAAVAGLSPARASANCDGDGFTGQQVMGTIIGAAVGGLLGSQIGGGTGRSIAIGAGALAGGLLGGKFGRDLDCRDQQYHGQAAQDALENQSSGTASSWQNPDTGHTGSVTPTSTYQRENGQYCRDFEQSITVDGQVERAQGTACRQSDGTWQVVS